MDYNLTNKWTALSILTGIDIGKPVIIQNIGRAGDLVEVILSPREPLESERGLSFGQITPLYRIEGQTTQAWIRYIRYDLNGTITPKDSRTCLISVMPADFITENNGGFSSSSIGALKMSFDYQLSKLIDQSSESIKQLKLMNERIEEAFETRIFIGDIEDEN